MTNTVIDNDVSLLSAIQASIMPATTNLAAQTMSNNSRLVYSTEVGRIKPEPEQNPNRDFDGTVRIRRESKGRGGKMVSVIEGIPADQQKAIGKLLKACCATGGAIKNEAIEIQGDHRETIKTQLEKKGFTVRFSGG